MKWRGAWRNASIPKRLFILSTAWTLLILIAGGLTLSLYHQHELQEAFDERLSVYLRALVAEVANGSSDEDPGSLGDPQFDLVASGRYWQITRVDDGKKGEARTSKSLFTAQLPKLADLGIRPGVGGARSGTVTGPGGRSMRIVERTIDTGDNGIFLVQVASTTEEMSSQIAGFDAALGVIFAMLAAGLLAVTAAQVRIGLRPLRQLEDSIEDVRLGEAQRIEGRFPPDVAPLADELNLLIAANHDIVERARVQVGNLAHALKTPLSVLTNEDPGDDGVLAAKVREQAAIMRDQVGYYLDRARVAARAGAIGPTTEVAPVLDGLHRTFGKIYRDRDISMRAPEATRFLGEKQDFEEMVGNLLDNACKWSQARVEVEVGTEEAAAGRVNVVIHIDDDGPGLSATQRAEAVKRGKRLDETKPGSGLGLSIVSDLAAAYRGTFALDSGPLGGVRATLRLPGITG